MQREKWFERAAAFGILAAISCIAIAIAGPFGEDNAEGFLILSPVFLVGVVAWLTAQHADRPGNRIVSALGLVGCGTLIVGSLASAVHPEPFVDALWFTVLMTTLVSGVAWWMVGANWMAIRYQTVPAGIALVGTLAGLSWGLLLASSISVWQSIWPVWLLNLNILIWVGANIGWMIGMVIFLFWSDRFRTPDISPMSAS